MQQAEILDNLMGNSPYAFIMNKVWEQYKENTNTFYRMFTYHDFFSHCKCGGDMMHTKSSKQAPPSYVKVYNWVRPNLEQTMSLSEGMRNHILNGGLILEDELK